MGVITYTPPKPHYQAAANGNKNELRNALVTLDQRLSDVETRAGGGSISLSQSSPVSSPPTPAKLDVSATPGTFVVQITNPQFQGVKPSNLPHVPVYHQVEFSDTASFTNPTALPIGVQTYYEVGQFGSAKKYVRLTSSFDQQNFNSPQVSGPHTT